ncbi:MAG: hypothetical protein ABI718_04125 [Acidobacteriota bacterium]
MAQIINTPLSVYESKSQRIDRANLAESHEVATWTAAGDNLEDQSDNRLPLAVWRRQMLSQPADIVHFYGPPPHWAASLRIRSVASAAFPRPRLPWKKANAPTALLSPLGDHRIPEAVEQKFFDLEETGAHRHTPPPFRLGTFGPWRRDVRRMSEQTLARLSRFRDDCQWDILDHVPTPVELASYDAWIDPTSSEGDLDGLIAEALVIGCVVVACRNAINTQRLANAEAGFLVPPGDANEMTHVIASALFREETTSRRQRARTLIDGYRPEVRGAALQNLYEGLLHGSTDEL